MTRRLLPFLALGALLASPAAASGQGPGAGRSAAADLKRLSMEELLQVEVTSAAKRPQSVAATPAAVSVLTAEDIRRSGARTLADVLRSAAGLHVARFDGRTWAVSARGLNQQTTNKMLVLIDGRSVYSPLFSGVFWDVQTPLLEDVERIEVVRGPGATLWGANAVNGVINVITASAAATQGGLVVAGAGNEVAFGALRWGGRLGAGHYRASAKLDSFDGLVLADGRDAQDPLRLARASFRADLPSRAGGDFTLLADLYGGRIGHRTIADSDVDGGSLQGRWTRPLAGGSELEVRAWYDHTFRRIPTQFQEERHTADVEVQHRWRRGTHDLLWGGGFRRSDDSVQNRAVFGWEPEEETLWIASLFAQDQWSLGESWRLLAGVRLEEQSTMDLEVLPSATLAWDAAPGHLVWLGAARAVRAPTRLDRDVRVPGAPPYTVVGSRDFAAEESWAYELGYRTSRLPADATLEVVAFYNDYEKLRSQEPSAAGLPLVLANGLEGRTRGVAASGNVSPVAWLVLHGGLTWLDTELRRSPGSRDPTGGVAEANDPDHHGYLRADFLLRRGLELSTTVRRVGELRNPRVPAYTELDLRLAWMARRDLELALVGENLLDDHHPELGPAASRAEVERGVYAQATWRF